MQLLSWSCPGLPGSVHVPLWSRPLLARAGGQSCTGACPRAKQVRRRKACGQMSRGTGSARPLAEGRELGDRVPGGSLTGSETRSKAPTEEVPGSQRPARRAPTLATATRLPAPGREIPTASLALQAGAARCPATVRARRLPACFAWRQHATAWRGQQRPRPCPALFIPLRGRNLRSRGEGNGYTASGIQAAILAGFPASSALQMSGSRFVMAQGACVFDVSPAVAHLATARVLAPQPTPSHPAGPGSCALVDWFLKTGGHVGTMEKVSR